MDNQTVSPLQLASIVALLRISSYGRFASAVTYGTALNDGWISTVIATIVGALLGYLASLVVMRNPDDDFGTLAVRLLGRPIGKGAAAAISLFFAGLVVVGGLQACRLIIATALTDTPCWPIGLLIFLVGLYGAWLGTQSLGRTAVLFFGLVLLYFFLASTFLAVSEAWDFGHVLPVLVRGWGPVLESAVVPTFSFATAALVVLAIGPHCRPREHTGIAVVGGIAVTGLMTTIWNFYLLAIEGPRQALSQLSPLYSLAVVVFVRGVIERADLLLFSTWVMGIVIEVAVFAYSSATIAGSGFGVRKDVLLYVIGLGAGVALVANPTLFDLTLPITAFSTGLALLVIHLGIIGLTVLVQIFKERRRVG